MERGNEGYDVVFYDGGCGFCHSAVRFLAVRDRRGRLRFAPRGGPLFERTFSAEEREAFPASMIVRTVDGKTLLKSTGTAYLLQRLGGWWGVLGLKLWAIPRPLRDAAYAVVARVRHRLAAKPDGVCPVLPAALRSRFVE